MSDDQTPVTTSDGQEVVIQTTSQGETVVVNETPSTSDVPIEKSNEEHKSEEPKISEQIESKSELPPVKKKHIGGLNTHPENINKGGRPKRGWTWAGLLAQCVEEVHPKSGKVFKELISKRLIYDAANGNIHAVKELMNRMDGMPVQPQELSGPGGGPIPILQGASSAISSDASDE